ncbi:MAG TPA: lysophospholipid acyltransferase family protein, partial [Myxococcaceae bacterium]|nr:lysophospholipid acyltransferase family protein [Myxococcaceae bacterium]
MIPARRTSPFTPLLDAYVRFKVRSAFRGFWVRGALPADVPVLAYANHTNFWDGFIVHQLALTSRREGFAMMEEKNLRKYPFLSRIGAFSVRPDDPTSALESLRYAQGLLTRPRATVYVFPEGEHRPFNAGPIRLKRGLELLARRAKVACVPLAIRYAFFEHERPEVLINVGDPHPPSSLAACE